MAKTSQTQDELKKQLNDQLELLELYCDHFDKGKRVSAKPMATAIRVLLHDTPSSHSLLGLLQLKDNYFFDSSVDYKNASNEIRFGSFCGLIGVSAGGTETYIPNLDDPPEEVFGLVPFDAYWNRVIFIDNKQNTYTRKEIVLAVANQDGGAHVDPKIDNKYKQIARENSLGIKTSSDGILWNDPNGPALAAIRQIAHEILRTLIQDYPTKKPIAPGSNFIIGGSGITLTMNSNTIEQKPNTETEYGKVGRNEKCPCGSGLKYKKCHGK